MDFEYVDNIRVTGKITKGFFYRTVAIQSDNINGCLELMHRLGIKNLSINSQWGWDKENKNIDFVKENKWIEGVNIIDDDIEISGINNFINLKRLVLADKFKGILDFGNFKNLEVCRMKWNNKQHKNFDTLENIKYLMLSRLNRPDLKIVSNFKKLIEFEIVYGYNDSLEGLQGMQFLRKLDLLYLQNLSNVEALEKINDSLKELKVIGCKKITDYSPIEQLEKLDMLVISEGNPIKSVSFLDKFNLKDGHIGVEVLDKKIDVLIKKKIGYKKFKSYSN